jgi:V-type H+-transporting ATPase subunit H
MVEANGSTQASSSAPEKVPTPPLVHLNNTWLSELSARIRARPIPWEGYQRADLVSQPELRMIRAVDAKPRAAVDGVIDAEGPAYARLYLTLLGKLSRTDTLQQVLVLVADMLDGRDDRAALFLHVPESGDAPSSQGSDAWPWAPLVK